MVSRGRAWLVRALSILVLLLLWEGAGRLAASPLAPPASAVLATLAREVASGALPHHVGITLARVAASFLLAMVAGTALGLAMGWWRTVDLWLDSALLLLLNLPALVLIVLLYVWFGLTEAAAIAAVALNKLPTTAVTVREGVRALDRDLLEMGHAFRFGRAATLRHVVLPQLQPYLFAATRSGLALIWKIVLVVELLGRSDGVGFQIQVYFQLFDVAHILAYSLAFILIIQIIEWAVFQPLERWATRWKAS
ncbi:ABC transporter permease [Nitrospirillum sp. BR 11828]|uniref:ABC transporter permease n=1 Tax=Nitrospirillum sp. BR 11828 TaxID=3104325 RepID=UPI002ACAE7A2|nr:ABC transporter permease subunit [Nitrospirillum sp. BR 11828]MDZ5645883.1 ABC transporter permease subunit [Nitrospirillum sp. BR 11828]